MRHAIFTCSDARYCDFVLEHWLPSLRANVNLDNIDILLLDYGLTEDQRSRLENLGVQCRRCQRDGHVTNIRYRDMAMWLTEATYDQVMVIDSGDIIFQSDISHLFDEHKSTFRATCQKSVDFYDHEKMIPANDLRCDVYEELFRFLRPKVVINAGMLLAPSTGIIGIWQMMKELTHSLVTYATDQYIVNYTLYQSGFVQLEEQYNFVIVMNTTPFTIKHGVFYDEAGEVIPVVHNAGNTESIRCVRNFGYGPNRNQFRRFRHWKLMAIQATTRWLGGREKARPGS